MVMEEQGERAGEIHKQARPSRFCLMRGIPAFLHITNPEEDDLNDSNASWLNSSKPGFRMQVETIGCDLFEVLCALFGVSLEGGQREASHFEGSLFRDTTNYLFAVFWMRRSGRGLEVLAYVSNVAATLSLQITAVAPPKKEKEKHNNNKDNTTHTHTSFSGTESRSAKTNTTRLRRLQAKKDPIFV